MKNKFVEGLFTRHAKTPEDVEHRLTIAEGYALLNKNFSFTVDTTEDQAQPIKVAFGFFVFTFSRHAAVALANAINKIVERHDEKQEHVRDMSEILRRHKS